MWRTITFKTRAEMLAFTKRHEQRYLMFEINIKNGYALNFRNIGEKNVWN